MGKEIAYTLNLDANISGIISQAEKAKKALENVLKSGNAPIGLEKVFGRLNELVASIKEKTKEPLTATSDFSNVENDVKKVLSLIGGVIGSVHTLSESTKKEKISLLPPETQKQLADADTALKTYTNSLKEASKASKELREAQGSLKKAQINREAAENVKTEKITAIEETKKKIATPSAAEQALEARIKEAEQAQKELEEAQAALEKLSGTDKRKKEYRDAKKRFEGAQSKAFATAAAAVPTQEELKAIEEAKKAREEYTETLKLQEAELEKVTKEVERATLAEEKAQARVEAAQGRSDEENLKKKQDAYKSLYDSAKKLIPGFNDLGISMDYSEENSKKLTAALQNLENNALKNLDSELDDSTNAFENIANSARNAREEIREGTEAFKQMTDAASEQQAFEAKIKSFLGLSGAAQVLRSALRDAMQTITELDATMAEMAVVTNLDISDYWDQLPQYTERANDLGLAIGDVYKADTLFYQQGLKTNEVVAISTETMKMASIAGLDTAEATDRMTAALRGFNMELNETSAQKIADVYSELAAITAADVDEISTAMTKTASIASSAGMEFETTAAFLSQIIETTRESAETAGTAMKTVIARFQELKKSPDEIGEVDGEIVDANAIETALRSVGVSLRDASGQFRELDDVFLELSGKWNTLDKNTQRYIATIAAGSRQQSRFIAMMSDYKRTTELVTAANNSAGASQEQFEKKAESLGFKINQLKNAWHEFTMGIMESDLLKFGVDILTKFLEIINKMTKGIGEEGLGGGFLKIMSILGIFKMGMKVFEKFKGPLLTFFGEIVKQAGIAGEKSGQAFKEGVQTATTQENQEGNSQQSTNQQQRVTSSFGDGKLGKMSTLGMRIIGADHFVEASTAHKEVKKAKDFLGKNKEQQQDKKDKYLSNKKRIEELQKENELTAEQQKELKDLTQSNQEYEAAVESLSKNGQKQFQAFSEGISAASSALMGVGMGLGMVGSALEAAGMEEGAKVFNVASRIFATTGAVLGIIPPILSVIQMLFPGVGAASAAAGATATASGVAASTAWSVVGIIVLAVVAAIVVALAVVLIILAAVKNASPEKKLENAQKAADDAAEAADRAAESYQNLADAFDELGSKYDNLEKLVQGTKEWNEAVQEINTSILDLIDEYPELAKFVENKEGVLHIDLESDEVQQVLSDAEATMVTAKAVSMTSNMDVTKARNDVLYSDLSKNAKIEKEKNFGGTVGSQAGIGAAIGATALGGLGTFIAPGVLTAIGAVVGGAIGGVVGTVSGLVTGAIKAIKGDYKQNEELGIESEEQAKEKTDEIAMAMASGRTGTTQEELLDYLNTEMKMTGESAEELAARFYANRDELIAYGEALNTAKEQEMAIYDALAASVVSLVDTMQMSEQELRQMNNIIGGEQYKAAEDEMNNLLKNVEMDQDDSGDDWHEDLQNAFDDSGLAGLEGVDAETYTNQALEAAGYKNAKLGEDGEVEYQDAEGKFQTATLTDEQLKTVIKSYYATDKVKNLAENTPKATSTLIEKVREKSGDDTANALAKALEDKSGANLTKAEYELIKNIDDTLITSYGEMDAALQEVFVSSSNLDQLIDNAAAQNEQSTKASQEVLNSIKQGIAGEGTAIEGVSMDAYSFMTAANQTSYAQKMSEVFQKTGGTTGVQNIKQELDKVLEGFDTDKAQEVWSRIDNTNWGNLEELMRLETDLQAIYGIEEKTVSDLIETIGEANYATSGLATTLDVFGDLYKANRKLEYSMNRVTQLQYNYDKAIASGASNVESLTNALMTEYQKQATLYEESFQGKIENVEKLLGQKTYVADASDPTNVARINLADYITFDEDTNFLDVSGLQRLITEGRLSEEDQEWANELVEAYDATQEDLDGLRTTLDNIEALEQQAQDAFYELRDMAKDAILSSLQEQIDLQQANLEATKAANATLINKIQETVNQTRQERQNEEAEQNIANLHSQQAYLSMDTSGAMDLQSQELDKTIEQAEQDYQDTLIDQTIQSLQDANVKAEEQRERQISLAQEQLNAYTQSAEFQQAIDSSMQEMLAAEEEWRNTGLGELMWSKLTAGLSEAEKEQWKSTVDGQVNLANTYTTVEWDSAKSEIGTKIDSISSAINGKGEGDTDLTTSIGALGEKITGVAGEGETNGSNLQDFYTNLPQQIAAGAEQRALSAAKTKLQGAGFSSSGIENLDMEQLNQLDTFVANQDAGKTAAGSQQKLSDAKVSYKSQADWVTKLEKTHGIENILQGTDKNGKALETYEQYLQRRITEEKTSAITTASEISNSSNTGLRGLSSNKDYEAQLNKYIALGGSTSDFETKVKEQFKATASGHFPETDKGSTYVKNMEEEVDDQWWFGDAYVEGQKAGKIAIPHHLHPHYKDWFNGGQYDDKINALSNGVPQQGWLAMYNGEPYGYNGWGWAKITNGHNVDELNTGYANLKEKMLNYLTAFKTGGIADFTGPAWLDGTPSRPEYILNAAQTERFFSLVDVLEGIDTKEEGKKISGDNYFDINISVEKLENDYDVEQVADKIRRMIYEDASYRNVNAINLIR